MAARAAGAAAPLARRPSRRSSQASTCSPHMQQPGRRQRTRQLVVGQVDFDEVGEALGKAGGDGALQAPAVDVKLLQRQRRCSCDRSVSLL